MTKEKILNLLKEHHDEIKNFKVQKMFLFGSVARGEETASSDVDILIKFTTPPYL